MAREISIAEVKKHNDKSSVWTIIHDDVYDVTSFLEEHPGGEDTLLEVAGLDGTQGFEDVGHSDDARELLRKYKIGTLSEHEKKKPVEPCRPLPSKSDKKELPTPRAERRVQSIVVPRESSKLKWALIALAGAIVVGVVLKKYLSTR